MSAEVLDLLGRQGAFLRAQEGAACLASIAPYLQVLGSEPKIAPHLNALREEAFDLGRAYQETVQPVVEAAYEIEYRYVAQEDARADEGNILGWSSIKRLYDDTNFPAIVPLSTRTTEDRGRAGRIVASVGAHLVSVPWQRRSSDPEAVQSQFTELLSEYERLHLEFLLRAHVHPGIALLRLEAVVLALCKAIEEPSVRPTLVVETTGEREFLYDAVAQSLSSTGSSRLLEFIVDLRSASERLELELGRRIDTVLSRLALVERYRARAEWHDSERLRELAETAVRPEERLRDDFGRYLFDQGLDPLSEMRVGGGLRPDLVDIGIAPTFFVEAKRHDGTRPLERVLAEAVRQTLDTATRLYAEMRPREAFIVIFRTKGPRCVLPAEPLEVEGLSIYLRLVDLAPAAETGSRARSNPRVFDLDSITRLAVDTR